MSTPSTISLISFEEAVATVSRELARRGLAATHRISALHGWPDATAEGASFAASILPSAAAARRCLRDGRTRLKFLIGQDGRVSVRPWPSRTAALHEDQP